MIKRPAIFEKLPKNYLFPEIERRVREYQKKYPDASLIRMGVGNTVKPLPHIVSQKLEADARAFSTLDGYRGYGNEQGLLELRKEICCRFYPSIIQPDEIFVSDGAKCDIGRLQTLFGRQLSVALQDPAYPVYLEGSLIQGIESVTMLPCHRENGFFPAFNKLKRHDLIYMCHPNNPTGIAYTRDQLQQMVDFALAHRCLILFDVAYASFIQDDAIPKSIYEIAGAEKVAIEVGSFSKMAGFAGLRLGWTSVPHTLQFEGGGEIWQDWKRLNSIIFNGASYLIQQAGLTVLQEEGWKEVSEIRKEYLSNAKHLKTGFEALGYKVFGGQHIPYLWVDCAPKKSWEAFDELLEKKQIVVTPGVGFGKEGENYIRVSGFAHQSDVALALSRLLQNNSSD